MASRRPLVLISGDIHQLPVGDTIEGSVAGDAVIYEPMLSSGNGNLDVVYVAGTSPVPDFMLSSSGDVMVGLGE